MRSEMTEFGRTVWVLAAKRQITTQKALSDRLHESGADISAYRVRNYLVGRTTISTRFLAALDRALDLSEEEKMDLAMVYAWGEAAKVYA